MKYILFTLLLLTPVLGNAEVLATRSAHEKTQHLSCAGAKMPQVKTTLFGRIYQKFWRNKWVNKIATYDRSTAKTLPIAGCILPIFAGLTWFIYPLFALLASIPIGIAGLTLCIIALAKSARRRGLIKWLAALGIVLNILLILSIVAIFKGLFGY